MAVAAPARRTAPAPPPSRTSPPPKRKSPSRKPAPARGAAAPARTAPARKRKQGGAGPRARAAAPARRAPARRAPARAPQRSERARRALATGQLIPLAVGRTAVAVRHLPDSGLMVRMTRGRAWIAVLGILLAGIVALNVVTLSFAASAGKIDQQITALEEENSVLGGREAQKFGTGRVRHEAGALGLAMPNTEEPRVIEAGRDSVAKAAARLAAAGG